MGRSAVEGICCCFLGVAFRGRPSLLREELDTRFPKSRSIEMLVVFLEAA